WIANKSLLVIEALAFVDGCCHERVPKEGGRVFARCGKDARYGAARRNVEHRSQLHELGRLCPPCCPHRQELRNTERVDSPCGSCQLCPNPDIAAGVGTRRAGNRSPCAPGSLTLSHSHTPGQGVGVIRDAVARARRKIAEKVT